MIETLSRKLHGYKVEFTSNSKAWRSSLKAKEDSDNPELVEQDIKRFKAQADKYAELIRETKEQISVEYNKQKAKRKAVDPMLMNAFYTLKDVFFECKRCGKDYKVFNQWSSSNITEEDYKQLHSLDFADLMRALKIMAENKINK